MIASTVGLDGSDRVRSQDSVRDRADAGRGCRPLRADSTPSADVWAGSSLLEPTYKQGPDGIEAIYATALVAPEAYPRLAASRAAVPLRLALTRSIRRGSMRTRSRRSRRTCNASISSSRRRTIATLRDVVRALRSTTSRSARGLLGIVDGFAAQRARTESVAVDRRAGPARPRCRGDRDARDPPRSTPQERVCCSPAVAALPARCSWARSCSRRSFLPAARRCSAGCSPSYAVPARDAPLSVILVIARGGRGHRSARRRDLAAARRPLIQLERDDPAVSARLAAPARDRSDDRRRRCRGRRPARQRGLTLGTVGGGQRRFDPLLAAVPLLDGLRGGHRRRCALYPLPVRGLGRLAARRRDFVPGGRPADRGPTPGQRPTCRCSC